MIYTNYHLQMQTCLSTPIPYNKYILPSHPNISNYNLSYNANMGYNKYQTQFTADINTWYCIP